MTADCHVVIAGASGVIGSAALDRFGRLPGWRVTALSRRRPVVPEGARFDHLALDLADGAACADAVAAMAPVTHLVFAAVSETPGLAAGWRDPGQIAANAALFDNLVEPLARAGALRHVSLLQGAKAYGAHVHAVQVPLRERQPRDDHANFYWRHEDRLRAEAARAGFGFTIWRPQVLLGWAPGAAMNPVAAIGAYASLCREQGHAFALPGDSEALWEMVDAGLLADAMAWAAAAPEAVGETFNVTNGDVFVLRHAWDELAARLGLATAGAAPAGFHALFAQPESEAAWGRLAARHGLLEPSLAGLVGQSDHYLDLLLAPRIAAKANPVLLSTIKLRQAGFAGCRDSLESLCDQLARMVALKLLPPLFR
ncbi:MAG: NAD-dependent epimerase/dehydratase family protein [Sphingomonadales bacterium]|nr:NAD-dependent epimerase/dehydratase family protein [Sphingomonadales bacterium]